MLNRALYGTIETARLWYGMFVIDAIKFRYEVNEVNMCAFQRVEEDNSVTVLVLHVDDCFIRASSEATIDKIIKQWDDKYPSVTQHRGRIIDFIGMMLDYTIEGEVTITQKRFIDKLLLECEDIIVHTARNYLLWMRTHHY